MKKKLLPIFIISFLFFLVVGCTKTELKYETTPTVVTGDADGDIKINAKAKTVTIKYIAVAKGSTAPTNTQVDAGENYSSVTVVNKGTSDSSGSINTVVTLSAGFEYDFYFILKHKEKMNEPLKLTAKAKGADVLMIDSLAFVAGTETGTVKLNASANRGVIFYVLVAGGTDDPTKEQVVAGINYGNVIVEKAGNSGTTNAITNLIIGDLVPNKEYKIHLVAKDGEELTNVKTNLTKAFLEVAVEDKGKGTLENPYKISTVADLEQIGKGYYEVTKSEWAFDSHYVLTADINLAEKYGQGKLNWEAIGAEAEGQKFSGSLDGQNHKIIGLYIDSPDVTTKAQALIACADKGSVIKNLILEDVYINGVGCTEGTATTLLVGSLVGYSKATITNVQVLNAEISARGTRVGGLVGRIYEEGDISNCYIEANVSGLNRVGGVAGVVDVADGTAKAIEFKNIVVRGTITGVETNTGGLFGYFRGGDVSNCIMMGSVEANDTVGGIFGFVQRRSGNSIITIEIKDNIMFGVVRSRIGNQIGSIIGIRSATGADGFITIGTNYQVAGTEVIAGTTPTSTNAFNGTELSLANLVNEEWYTTNVPSFDFTNVWEIQDGAEKPSLKNTQDSKFLPNLSTPQTLTGTAKTGAGNNEIVLTLSSNKVGTFYYLVLEASDAEPTVAEILVGTSGASFANAVITLTNTDTAYVVYYIFVEGETQSAIKTINVSTEATMTFDATVAPGSEPGKLDLAVADASHLGKIYFVVVAKDSAEPTTAQVKAGENYGDVIVLKKGEITDLITITGLENDTEYDVYFYSEKESGTKHSNLVLKTGKTMESSEDVLVFTTKIFEKTQNDKEFVLNLIANLDNVTIKYIITTEEKSYTVAEILAAVKEGNILFVGSEDSNVVNITNTLDDYETIYVYAVASTSLQNSAIYSASLIFTDEGPLNYGTGTLADPFIIRTQEELSKIGEGNWTHPVAGESFNYTKTSYYELENDIALVGNWTPLSGLNGTGSLNGNGFIISNLTINASTRTAGLFATFGTSSTELSTGSIKNLIIKDATVNSTNTLNGTTGTDGLTIGTGILVGLAYGGVFENIQIINSNITALGRNIGGLIGAMNLDYNAYASLPEANKPSIKNIYAEVNITAKHYIGGILAFTSQDTTATPTVVLKAAVIIENIVVCGDMTATDSSQSTQVGLVVGSAKAFISNVFVQGRISGKENLGGVFGRPIANDHNNSSTTATEGDSSVYNVLSNVQFNGIAAAGTNKNFGWFLGSPERNALLRGGFRFIDNPLTGNAFDKAPGAHGGSVITANEILTSYNVTSHLGAAFEMKVGAQRPTLIGTLDTGSLRVFTA